MIATVRRSSNMAAPGGDVTLLLAQPREGHPEAADPLLPLV